MGEVKGGFLADAPPTVSVEPRLRSFAAVCYTAVVAVAALVLLSWVAGLWQFLTLGEGYIPMAPSTALLFLGLGGGAMGLLVAPVSRLARTSFSLLIAGTASLAVLTLAGVWSSRVPWMDRWVSIEGGTAGGIALGRMSPFTAATFIVAALSLLLQSADLPGRRGARRAAAGSALVVALVGLVVSTGYAMGVPLSFGGGVIPMAAPTAITFIALALGALATTGIEHWPLSLCFPGQAGARGGRVFARDAAALVLLVTAVISTLLFFYLARQSAEARRGADEFLATLAELRATQVASWREERLADGESIRGNPLVCEAASRVLAHSGSPEDRQRVSMWFTSLQAHRGYRSVQLLDASGEAVFTVGDATPGQVAFIKAALPAILRAGKPMLQDLHSVREVPYAHLDLFVPICPRADGMPQGVVLVHIDPAASLFLLLRAWPSPALSGETVLVRREGGGAVALSPLKFVGEGPLKLRWPSSDLPLQEGPQEGSDYAGHEVLAFVEAVRGSPWLIMAKEDRDEILQEYYFDRRGILVTAGLLLLSLGGGIAALWRSQQVLWLQREMSAQRERAFLSRHFEHLVKYANDMILLADGQGRLLETNEATQRGFGRTREEMLALTLSDLQAPESRWKFPHAMAHLVQAGGEGLRYEEMAQRKDGSRFPVEVSARAVEVDGALRVQAILRDITERVRLEESRRESEARFRSIYENATIGLYRTTPDGRILMANPALVAMLGYTSMEELATRNLEEEGFEPSYPRETFLEAMERDAFVHAWESVWAKRDGGKIVVRESATAVRGSSGEVLYFDGSVEDITERVRAQESLKESERFALSTIDALPTHLCVVDAEGTILRTNRAWKEFAAANGGEADRLCEGANYFVACDEATGEEAAQARAFASGIRAVLVGAQREFAMEYPCNAPEEERWFVGRVSRFTGPGPLRAVVNHENVTTRRKSEAALRESEARYRLLFERNQAGVFRSTLGGELQECNEAFARILGYESPAEVESLSVLHLYFHPEDRAAFVSALAAHGGTRDLEECLRRKDGSAVWVLSTTSLLERPGEEPLIQGTLVDITLRKQADEALKASEEKYRLLADFTYDWEYWIGPDGKMIYTSAACERISGHTPQEFYQEPGLLLSIVHPEDRPALERHHDAQEREEEPCEAIDFRILAKGGEPRWINHACQPVYGDDGQFRGRRGSNRDITWRKTAEEEIRTSVEVFRNFFETNLAASYLATTEGQILHCNASFLELFDIPSAEAAQEVSVFDLLVSPEERRAFSRELAGQGQVTLRETGRRSVRGRTLTVLESATTIRDEEGAPTGFLGFILDITDRRRADRDRRLLTAALEQAHDAIVVLDDQQRILYMNWSFEALTGLTRHPPDDQRFQDCFQNFDSDQMRSIQEALAAGRPWTGQIAFKHTGGRRLFLDASFSALPRQNSPPLSLGVLRDVTAEIQMQERLSQAQRLETFGRVASGVAHEVRNPLFAISTVVAALERKVGTDGGLSPYMGHIQEHVHRLSRLMDDLLLLGRPLNRAQFVACDLMAVVHLALGDLEAAHPGSRSRFVVSSEEKLHPILGDPQKLSEALLNILSNALTFSPPEQPIQISLQRGSGGTEVAVSNAGPPIPEELLPTLFEPFVTTRKGGTGLGLAIVRQILAAHGGTVTAENLEGDSGVCFTMRVPNPSLLQSHG